jgi:hypothetical protein
VATITVLGSGLSAQAETTAPAPAPGTTTTSATALTISPVTSKVIPPASKKLAPRLAQNIGVGQATRGGSSYLGVAGNIGLTGGETALGVGNVAVISKIGLLRSVSLRPAAVFGDNTTVLIPLTYDFSQVGIREFSIALT